MAIIGTEVIQNKTYNKWGIRHDNTYINNAGGLVGNDGYWVVMGRIDVDYEASIGGTLSYSGMTLVENNRTNLNFYNAAGERTSTVYLGTTSGTIKIPSNAHFMHMSVRKNDRNDLNTVTVTLRQKTISYNTSDGKPATPGTIYDYNGIVNSVIGKMYDNDGTTHNQIGKVYDNNGTTHHLIYQDKPDNLFSYGNQCTDITGGWNRNGNWALNHIHSWDNRGNGGVSVSDAIYVDGGSGQYNGSMAMTKNKVDLSSVPTLKITFRLPWNVGSSNYLTAVVYTHIGSNLTQEGMVSAQVLNISNRGAGTYTWDVPTNSPSAPCFVGVGRFTSDGIYTRADILEVKCL